MKTGTAAPSVVQVNFIVDNELNDPGALVERYTTLTGWAEAVAAAGARSSSVVQRFSRRAELVRNGVRYVFTDRGIGAAVAKLEPDVTHVNGLVFPLRTWALRRALPKRAALVAQNHSDTGPMGRAPLLRTLGRATRAAVDAYLFAAPEHVARWRGAGFIGPAQPTYCVMEASTDMRPASYADARARTAMIGSPALLWVGRLDVNKDPLTVLAGFEACASALPDAALTMVFTATDLLGAVTDRIARSPTLSNRVRLAGAVPRHEMPFFFSGADLFVLGSHHEGSGYALIEAIACGATPVVTNIPTFRLLTGDGAIGASWTPGDAAGCAAALRAAAARAAQDGRKRIVEHFDRHLTWAAIGRRAVEIYTEVVRSRA